LKARCEANFDRAAQWVSRSDWCDFLAGREEIRSQTSICLKIVDPELDQALHSEVAKAVTDRLVQEQVALDAGAYRNAPPGFRFWAGATVEAADLALALEWLDWSYHEVRKVARP
jgi:phosphoserine aminotransferase